MRGAREVFTDRFGQWRLVALFGVLSFLQGVSEPTEGLLSQPLRSRMLASGIGTGDLAWFATVVSLPWVFKPLLGLMTDVVPLFGSRRRAYLVASGAIGALAFLTTAIVPGSRFLIVGLLVASAAVTLADVSTDAIVVGCGQSDGQTSRYQAAQWFCLYASGIVNGSLGGALSGQGVVRFAALLCALAMALMLIIAAAGLQEPIRLEPNGHDPIGTRARNAGRELWKAVRAPGVLAVAAFLIVGNFNPFMSTNLLQVHMTRVLGFSEQFFGHTFSVQAIASMTAAALYGTFAKRISLRRLAHLSVVLGIVCNLVYAGMSDHRSALTVSIIVGLAWMTATLIQVELAAVVCPPAATATLFATFMAVSNLSASVATWLSGVGYEMVSDSLGRPAAFRVLVIAGAVVTAGGWLIVPFLPVERTGTDLA